MGRFSTINGIPRNRMAILNADGSLDPDFQPQPDAQVYSAVHLADGKFLVAGRFTQMNGVARGGLVRLNPDGSLDTSFNFNRPTAVVTSLAVQMNGRILYAASGTVLRALENGDHDPSFSPPYLSFLPVRSIIPQTNGKVLAGISNSNAMTPQKDGVIRLNADGKIDSTFECPLSGLFDTAPIEVLGIHLGNDARLLIGGSFARAGTEPRTGLIRTQLEAPVESLTVPSTSRIEWRRGGGLPDSNDITFALLDSLTNTWIPLGRGTSIPGGWELTGLSLPAAGTIRATARVSGGRTNSSYSFCDSTRPYEIGPLQAWRLQFFSTADNTGQAANGADPDLDGLTNLAEYALGLVPTLPDAAGLPTLEAEDGHLELRFTPPSTTSNILYTAEASDDPSASSWTPVEDSGMAPECRFRLPLSAQRLYMRLRFLSKQRNCGPEVLRRGSRRRFRQRWPKGGGQPFPAKTGRRQRLELKREAAEISA
jgi:uncharacterized delta-60 repeat protein